MSSIEVQSRIPTYMRRPEGYQAPSRSEITDNIAGSGIQFKGKAELGAVATGPTMLPESLGDELVALGDSLRVGYWAIGRSLKARGEQGARTESFVRSHVPDTIPTDPSDLSKRNVVIMRPDVVLTSHRNDQTGNWELRGGIAEVETRPAGTFIYPALLEGYGISSAEYMRTWVEHFHGRPWAAVIPEEWNLYEGELNAFGKSLEKHGGTFAGVHHLDHMSQHAIDEALPPTADLYVFGYMDVWQRSGSLDKVQMLQRRKGTHAYNAPDYYLETKATLTAMKDPRFLDKLADEEGAEHAERLDRWLGQSYVLSVHADQEVNYSQLIKDRKKWILKRAGFDPDATESRGLVMPNDPGGAVIFERTLREALSGNNGPWIAQEYIPSRVPQEFYNPSDDFNVGHFAGAARLTPIYLTQRRDRTDMVGVMSTVTFGSDKAHGGSGEAMKPGMSVMAPVLFGETPNLVYAAENHQNK